MYPQQSTAFYGTAGGQTDPLSTPFAVSGSERRMARLYVYITWHMCSICAEHAANIDLNGAICLGMGNSFGNAMVVYHFPHTRFSSNNRTRMKCCNIIIEAFSAACSAR